MRVSGRVWEYVCVRVRARCNEAQWKGGRDGLCADRASRQARNGAAEQAERCKEVCPLHARIHAPCDARTHARTHAHGASRYQQQREAAADLMAEKRRLEEERIERQMQVCLSGFNVGLDVVD